MVHPGMSTTTSAGPRCPTCGQRVHQGGGKPAVLAKAVAALWVLSLFAALAWGLLGGGWAAAGAVAAVATGLAFVFAVVTGGGGQS